MRRSGYTDAAARARSTRRTRRALENVEELVAVTREFRRQNPGGTLVDFLTETALVAARTSSTTRAAQVSLMTLHTAKGLEFEAVFITGVEEDLLPHRMSAKEPGGPAEERRLFYVGITRARQRLHLSLAMTRAQFGEVTRRGAEPLPGGDPGRAHRLAHAAVGVRRSQPRALNARGDGRGRVVRAASRRSQAAPQRPKRECEHHHRGAGQLGDSSWTPGDRIRHKDFGEGRVQTVTGAGAKRIAEVLFDTAGRKRLLIKIAPIEVISRRPGRPEALESGRRRWPAAAKALQRWPLGPSLQRRGRDGYVVPRARKLPDADDLLAATLRDDPHAAQAARSVRARGRG